MLLRLKPECMHFNADTEGEHHSDFVFGSINRLVERAVDKSSRLLPYEESVSHLEGLYAAVNIDDALSSTTKQSLISLINQLENSLQVCLTCCLNLRTDFLFCCSTSFVGIISTK